jgi:hypothetical protein
MSVQISFRNLYQCDTHRSSLTWHDHCCTVQTVVVELKFGRHGFPEQVHPPDVDPETNLTYQQLLSLGEGKYDLEFLKAISSNN